MTPKDKARLEAALKKASQQIWAQHPNNPKNKKPRKPTVRLSRKDWGLIREALDMLLMDYEDGHPDHERLIELFNIAQEREHS